MIRGVETYNVRKILSPSSSLPLLAKTNAPCSVLSLGDSLFVSQRQAHFITFQRFIMWSKSDPKKQLETRVPKLSASRKVFCMGFIY